MQSASIHLGEGSLFVSRRPSPIIGGLGGGGDLGDRAIVHCQIVWLML